MEISIIFKIAGIGICIALVNQILVRSIFLMNTDENIVKMLAEFFETMKVFMEF